MEENASHAPYVDEETARYERKKLSHERDKQALKDEITELESEVKSLETENKKLRNSVSSNDVSTNTDVEGADTDDKSSRVAGGQALGTFEATYYGMDCVGCSGRTASGYNASSLGIKKDGMSILAADTSVIPLHSVVRVTNPDGSSYKGIVLDRGGAIKGKRLDVLVGSEAESSKYGRHNVTVEVLSYGDNKYRKEG